MESPTFTTPNIGAATGTTLTLSDDIIFSANKVIRRNTSDGSDNGVVEINGGGATGSTRGGAIYVTGNEESNVHGSVIVHTPTSGGFRYSTSAAGPFSG